MVQFETKEFGKWRSFFWPIHTFELKKVVPMLLMFFFISFNYSILRNVKETLIITAPGSGAETILFIKSWVVFPSAVLFTIIYAKLSNILSKQSLFYSVITPFLLFFAAFALVLYPNRDQLHPTAAANTIQSVLPEGLMGLVAIFRNWTYAIFYVLAELWGSFMLSLMFWGFANEITRISEAKRFYTLFGVGANLALLCSGAATVFVSDIRQKLPAGVDAWGISLNLLMGMVVLAGVAIVAIYWWINRYLLTDSRFYDPHEQLKKKKEKPQLSLKESFLYLAKSPYIGYLAILVIAYGISVNIVEVTWKNQLKLQYPNSNDYNTFMGYFSSMTGAVTILMMLFVGGYIVRRFGWAAGALITPIVLLITGFLFFGLMLFEDHMAGFIALLGTTPLFLAVVIGTFQNIMTKSCKYSLFDPTKEMAYIPLDQEQKVKGKAAIDVVGSRLGKSGGSLLQQALLVGLGSMTAITPYLAFILIIGIVMWIFAAKALNKLMEKRSRDSHSPEVKEKSEPARA